MFGEPTSLPNDLFQLDAHKVPVTGSWRRLGVNHLVLTPLTFNEREFAALEIERLEAQHHGIARAIVLIGRAIRDVITVDKAMATPRRQQIGAVRSIRRPAGLRPSLLSLQMDLGILRCANDLDDGHGLIVFGPMKHGLRTDRVSAAKPPHEGIQANRS